MDRKAYKRQWKLDNPEKVRAAQRKWEDAHPEQSRARKRKWRNSNTDSSKEYFRNYRIENPPDAEKERERVRLWREANPEKERERVRRSTARRRATARASVSEKYTETQILELYGSSCHICGDEIDLAAPRRSGVPGWERGLHMDHVVSFFHGGTDTLSNVRPSHGKCNLKKHTSTVDIVREMM